MNGIQLMSIQSYGNRATKRFARGDHRYLPADHADKIEHLLLLNRASASRGTAPARPSPAPFGA